MTALYQITAQHKELLALAETDEDMQKAIADTMESIEGEFNDKAFSLISVSKSMGAYIPSIDSEIKRLQDRKRSIENKQKSMAEYLRLNMHETGITKIECPLFTITLCKGRDVVEIIDADKIPAEYLNIKTTMTPMKKELGVALKAGEEI